MYDRGKEKLATTPPGGSHQEKLKFPCEIITLLSTSSSGIIIGNLGCSLHVGTYRSNNIFLDTFLPTF